MKTVHTWEHSTVRSLAVVRLWIVHDNCGFTEWSVVNGFYYCSHFMHTRAIISHNCISLFLSRTFSPKMQFDIDCCIYSPTLQGTFDHMETNIDP